MEKLKKLILENKLVLIIAILLCISIKYIVKYNNEVVRLVDNHRKYEASLKNELKVKETKIGKLITNSNVLEVTNKELKDQVYFKDKELKEITDKYKKVLFTQSIETSLNIKDSIIYINQDTLSKCIKPHKKKFGNDDFSFNYSIDYGKDTFTDFILNNKLTNAVGIETKWFKTYITSTVHNTNKSLHIRSIHSQLHTQKIRRFNLVASITLNPINLQPQFGIGVGWSILPLF